MVVEWMLITYIAVGSQKVVTGAYPTPSEEACRAAIVDVRPVARSKGYEIMCRNVLKEPLREIGKK